MNNNNNEKHFDFVYLMGVLKGFFVSKSCDENVPNYVLMGKNRLKIFEIKKSNSKFFLFDSDAFENQVFSLQLVSNYYDEKSKSRQWITFGLDNDINKLKKVNSKGLRYTLCEENDKTSSIAMPNSFIFIHLLDRLYNDADKIFRRDNTLPQNTIYNSRMPILINYGLFYTPFNKVPSNEINHQNFNYSKIKEVIVNDLKLKNEFCSMILNDETIQSNIQFDSKFSDDYLFLLIEIYGLSFDIKRKIDEVLDAINRKFKHIDGNEELYNDLLKYNDEINDQYLKFLSAIFRVSLFPQNNRILTSVSGDLIAERIVSAGSYLKMFISIYHLILALSTLERKYESLSLENAVKIVKEFDLDSYLKNYQIEKIIRNDETESPILLKTLVKSAIDYDSDKNLIKLRKYHKDWYDLMILHSIDQFLNLTPKMGKQHGKSINEIIDEIIAENNKGTTEKLDLMKVKYFSENANDETFIEVNTENLKSVSVSFEPIMNNQHYIYQIPKYAGMFFKYIPSKDLEKYKTLTYQIRSIDQSIKKVTVEIKNTNRIDLDSFKFDVTSDWTLHNIEVDKIRPNIRDNVEEIVFLITPSSFSENKLKGQFEIQSVQLVK